ncbi:MAG TPA: hypothetical protein VLA52_10240 [Thermohalobaculum sp.]|nr:hypothetical protein [Thermohalobaculum sp.]
MSDARRDIAIVVDRDRKFRKLVADVLVSEFGFDKVVEIDGFESTRNSLPVFGGITLGIVGANCARSDSIDPEPPLITLKCLKKWVAVSRRGGDDEIRACLALGAAGVVKKSLGRVGVSVALDLVLGGIRRAAGKLSFAGGDAPAGVEGAARVADWPLQPRKAAPRRAWA